MTSSFDTLVNQITDAFRKVKQVRISGYIWNVESFNVSEDTGRTYIQLHKKGTRKRTVLSPNDLVKRWRVVDNKLHYIQMNLVTSDINGYANAEV